MSSLPVELVDHFTQLELVVLELLRQELPEGIYVQSLVETGQQFPLVLPRRMPDWGYWSGDDRFIDTGRIGVNVFCEGVNADNDCHRLSDAVRIALRKSINKPTSFNGHLTRAKQVQSPRRASDWATTVGPVQYADLPSNVTRFEAVYEIAFRTLTST